MTALSPSHLSQDQIRRQYVIRSSLFLAGYVAVNMAAIFGAFDDAKPRGAIALALVVVAPLAGHIWALLAYMRDADEFMRAVMARRFIISSGITMALTCAWGFMESYAHAWHAPGFLVYPLFWLVHGAVSPFIRSSN
ncbi:MAG: hypothetical protein V4662_09480 [Verrucomicrobiota bacterium]